MLHKIDQGESIIKKEHLLTLEYLLDIILKKISITTY